MTENKFININPQRQVGASEFWQSPSTRTMEDKNLRTGDHYSTFTVTMKSDDVDSYVAEWRDKGSSSQLVQITVTTLNGGMSQVAIRVQSLYQVQEEENDDDSGGDSDVGGGDTGGSDTDDRESASTTSCHVSFQECPICTHPDLSIADGAARNALGMVAKGANPYKPIVVDDSGTMATPISLVGADLIGLITTVPSYSVKVISISYTYTTRKNPLTQGPEVGSEVGMSGLPGNKLGGAFGRNGTATLLDRSYSKVGHVYQVTESYVVEVIPPLSEVKKRGGQA